jgi:hypothetical protein
MPGSCASNALTSVDLPAPDGAATTNRLPEKAVGWLMRIFPYALMAACALAWAPPNSVFYQEARRRASPAMRLAAAPAHILLVILKK